MLRWLLSTRSSSKLLPPLKPKPKPRNVSYLYLPLPWWCKLDCVNYNNGMFKLYVDANCRWDSPFAGLVLYCPCRFKIGVKREPLRGLPNAQNMIGSNNVGGSWNQVKGPQISDNAGSTKGKKGTDTTLRETLAVTTGLWFVRFYFPHVSRLHVVTDSYHTYEFLRKGVEKRKKKHAAHDVALRAFKYYKPKNEADFKFNWISREFNQEADEVANHGEFFVVFPRSFWIDRRKFLGKLARMHTEAWVQQMIRSCNGGAVVDLVHSNERQVYRTDIRGSGPCVFFIDVDVSGIKFRVLSFASGHMKMLSQASDIIEVRVLSSASDDMKLLSQARDINEVRVLSFAFGDMKLLSQAGDINEVRVLSFASGDMKMLSQARDIDEVRVLSSASGDLKLLSQAGDINESNGATFLARLSLQGTSIEVAVKVCKGISAEREVECRALVCV